MSIVIAVDGTAASGKGTLAKRLARHFGFAHLDSGALYRLTALAVLEAHGDPSNEADAVKGARTHRSVARGRSGDPQRRRRQGGVAGRRHPGRARGAARISSVDFSPHPPGESAGAVMDGRDIGTVIAPDATAKLFVDARPEVRAHRRWLELQEPRDRAGTRRICWPKSSPAIMPTAPAPSRP